MIHIDPLLANVNLKMKGKRSPRELIKINICRGWVKDVTREAQWKLKRLDERPNGSHTGYKRGPMEV